MDAPTDATAPVAADPAGVLAPPGVDPRRWHYREFYGLVDSPPGAGIVLGNCQAESIRIVIDGAAGATVRVPPVHEFEADDLPHLDRLVSRAAFVITQPIRDDYRGLPVGTRQLRVGPTCRVVTVPSVRFAGLYPYQAAVRVPGEVQDPPVVVYHDVRELAEVAGDPLPATLPADFVRRIADDSTGELRRREHANDTSVVASDLFARPTFDHMRTINHAGNPVWLALGERVLAALGSAAAPVDPGRPLLASVEAPREQWVADAWGIDGARPHWQVDGDRIDPDAVREAHLQWYRANPEVAAAITDRLAPMIARWAAV